MQYPSRASCCLLQNCTVIVKKSSRGSSLLIACNLNVILNCPYHAKTGEIISITNVTSLGTDGKLIQTWAKISIQNVMVFWILRNIVFIAFRTFFFLFLVEHRTWIIFQETEAWTIIFVSKITSTSLFSFFNTVFLSQCLSKKRWNLFASTFEMKKKKKTVLVFCRITYGYVLK